MLTAYVRHLIFIYLDNIVGLVNRRQPQAAALVEWIAENIGLLDLDGDELDLPSDLSSDASPSAKVWKRLGRVVAAERKTMVRTPDRTARRLVDLGAMIGLSRDDVDIMEAVLRYETHPVVEDVIDDVGIRRINHISASSARYSVLPKSEFASVGPLQHWQMSE